MWKYNVKIKEVLWARTPNMVDKFSESFFKEYMHESERAILEACWNVPFLCSSNSSHSKSFSSSRFCANLAIRLDDGSDILNSSNVSKYFYPTIEEMIKSNRPIQWILKVFQIASFLSKEKMKATHWIRLSILVFKESDVWHSWSSYTIQQRV